MAFQRQRAPHIGALATSSACSTASCDPRRLDEVEDVLQREAVLGADGEEDGVVAGRRLELEVEADAEALAQGEAPGAVDARAEGGVNDELHAAASSKKRSKTTSGWVGTRPRLSRWART